MTRVEQDDRETGLTLKSQMQVTMFPIRRHSPSNLHVFVSHRNMSVSRSSKPGETNETSVNVPQQTGDAGLRSAVLWGLTQKGAAVVVNGSR